MKIGKPNRIKRTKPKKGKYWCLGCDRYLISQGKKCPVCGFKDIRWTLKKDNNMEQLDSEVDL